VDQTSRSQNSSDGCIDTTGPERPTTPAKALIRRLSRNRLHQTEDFTRRTTWEYLVYELSKAVRVLETKASTRAWILDPISVALSLAIQPQGTGDKALHTLVSGSRAPAEVPAELVLVRGQTWRASEPNTIARLFDVPSYWLLHLLHTPNGYNGTSSVLGALFYAVSQNLSDSGWTDRHQEAGHQTPLTLATEPPATAQEADTNPCCPAEIVSGQEWRQEQRSCTRPEPASWPTGGDPLALCHLPVFVQTRSDVSATKFRCDGIGVGSGHVLRHYSLEVQSGAPAGVDDLESLFGFFCRCIANWTGQEVTNQSVWESQCRLGMALTYEHQLRGMTLEPIDTTFATEWMYPRLRLALTLRWPPQLLSQYETLEVREAPEWILWLVPEDTSPASPTMDDSVELSCEDLRAVRLLGLAKHLFKMSRSARELPSEQMVGPNKAELMSSTEQPTGFFWSLLGRLRDGLEELIREDVTDRTISSASSPVADSAAAVVVNDLQLEQEGALGDARDMDLDVLTALALEAPQRVTDWAFLRKLFELYRLHPEVLERSQAMTLIELTPQAMEQPRVACQQQTSHGISGRAPTSLRLDSPNPTHLQGTSSASNAAATIVVQHCPSQVNESTAEFEHTIERVQEALLNASVRQNAASQSISSARPGVRPGTAPTEGQPWTLQDHPIRGDDLVTPSDRVAASPETPVDQPVKRALQSPGDSFTVNEIPLGQLDSGASPPSNAEGLVEEQLVAAELISSPEDASISSNKKSNVDAEAAETTTFQHVLTAQSSVSSETPRLETSTGCSEQAASSLRAFLEQWTARIAQTVLQEIGTLFLDARHRLSILDASYRSAMEACESLTRISSLESGIFGAHLEHALDELEHLLSEALLARLLQHALMEQYELMEELLRNGEVSLRGIHPESEASSSSKTSLIQHLRQHVFELSDEDVFAYPQTREYVFDIMSNDGSYSARLLFRLTPEACTMASTRETI
jgi:hypothetical protein